MDKVKDMVLVSVISTVLNEEDNIKSYIESLLNQTFIPDEIIIEDGNSYDKTYDILKEYAKKYPNLIYTYQTSYVNIAAGRNNAISKTRGVIIVTVDAGSEYERDYIKKMVLPLLKYIYVNPDKFNISKEEFEEYLINKGISLDELEDVEDAEFVQGKTYPKITNLVSMYSGKIIIKDKQCKIPSRTSARATAYLKYVWETVGGYPEKSLTGEDTKFNIEVMNRGFKWVCVDAKVYWHPPTTIKEFYKKLERYAIGDAIQGNIFKIKKLFGMFLAFWITILFTAYTILFERQYIINYYKEIATAAVSIYLLLGMYGIYKVKKWHAILLYPMFNIIRILAYSIGLSKGLIKRYISKK